MGILNKNKASPDLVQDVTDPCFDLENHEPLVSGVFRCRWDLLTELLRVKWTQA